MQTGGGASDDDDDSEEFEVDETTGERRRKKKAGKVHKLSKEKMAQIEAQIALDRKKLESQKDMAEEEKRQVEEELKKKEDELKKARLVKSRRYSSCKKCCVYRRRICFSVFLTSKALFENAPTWTFYA